VRFLSAAQGKLVDNIGGTQGTSLPLSTSFLKRFRVLGPPGTNRNRLLAGE
jgi:hypothetical protein